jgi:hypothetical protein
MENKNKRGKIKSCYLLAKKGVTAHILLSTRSPSLKWILSNIWGYISTGDLPGIATSQHYGNTWTSGPKTYTGS